MPTHQTPTSKMAATMKVIKATKTITMTISTTNKGLLDSTHTMARAVEGATIQKKIQKPSVTSP